MNTTSCNGNSPRPKPAAQPKKIKFVYVAGAYSANNIIDVFRNIRRGLVVSFKVLKAGFIPFIPWFDWLWLLIDEEESMEAQDFKRYSIEWMMKCDAVYVHELHAKNKPWFSSKGTLKEVQLARQLQIPVYHSLEQMISERGWLNEC